MRKLSKLRVSLGRRDRGIVANSSMNDLFLTVANRVEASGGGVAVPGVGPVQSSVNLPPKFKV